MEQHQKINVKLVIIIYNITMFESSFSITDFLVKERVESPIIV